MLPAGKFSLSIVICFEVITFCFFDREIKTWCAGRLFCLIDVERLVFYWWDLDYALSLLFSNWLIELILN